jgi:hypothetical protein
MGYRIRHCVECPKCLTRYLLAFSPYRNGSFLVPTFAGSAEEYTLYCSCGTPAIASRWKPDEVKRCEVSKEAHHRGYGSQQEVCLISMPRAVTSHFDVTQYLDWRFTDGLQRKKENVEKERKQR